MKRTIQILAGMAIIFLTVIACKDNFSEQDFLTFQMKQKKIADSTLTAKNAAALNLSGQLQSFTVQVLEDKTPVSGVSVVVSNPPAGSTGITLSATTDTNGMAVFSNIVIGSNTFVISKTGYITATFIATIGGSNGNGQLQSGVNYILQSNGQIVPIKQSASAQVPIFAKASSSGAIATVKGTVTIENDLTNSTPEIPQNLTITANLAGTNSNIGGGSGDLSTGNNVSINNYFFNDGSVGVATVDNTTGAYSMTVPASAAGHSININLPTIDGTQKLAIQRLNGVSVTPAYQTVPTTWGPLNNSSYDNIPQVPGAFATFNAPPPAGLGAKLNFAVVSKSLETGTMTNPTQVAPITKFINALSVGNAGTAASSTTYYLSNRGSGYTSSPLFTLTGGGASAQATMNASLAGVATAVNITAGGTNYSGSVSFQLQQTPDGINFYNTLDINGNIIQFSKDVGGTLIPLTGLTFAVPTSGGGFDPTIPFKTVLNTGGYTVQSFRWAISNGTGSGATATAGVSAYIDQVQVSAGGTGYTSAPSIAIAAPAAGTTATMSISEFSTQWTVSVDNSANNPVYSVMPSGINLLFSSQFNGGIVSNNSNVSDQFGNSSSLINTLTVSGGNIVWQDASKTYKTAIGSPAAPVASIDQSTSTSASASVTISTNTTNGTYGQITGLSSTVGGSGYSTPQTITISPTISGAPGSGAAIDLINVTLNNATKQYTWAGGGNYLIAKAGSGYLPYLNAYYVYYPGYTNQPVNFMVNKSPYYNNSYQIYIKAGDTQVYNIDFGTGQKKQNVN